MQWNRESGIDSRSARRSAAPAGFLKWAPLLAVLLSLALRAIYLAQTRGNPFFDVPIMDEGYHDLWAREIAAGDWTARLPFFRAPLYPVLLGFVYRIFGTDPPPYPGIRAFQLLLGAVTPWLVHRIARRVVPGRPAVAAAAALVVALDGILVYFEADLLLESLLAPLSVAFVLLAMRARETGSPGRWAAAGLALGLFAITRPNVLLFAPFLFLVAGWPDRGGVASARRPHLAAAAALTLATCLCVLPVTWVNARYGGDRVLIASQAGLNFFLGNNDEANGWSATAPSLMSVDWWAGYHDAVRIAEEESGRSLRPSEVSGYWFARALRWWRAHPGDGLGLTVRKIVYFFAGTEFSNNRNLALFLREFAPALSYSVWLLFAMMPLAVLGAVSLWRSGRPDARLAVGYVAVYGVSIVLFFVTARYRVPLRPILAIFAVEGARQLLVAWRASRARAAGLAGAVVVFAVAVNANGWVASHRPSPAQFYHSVAIVLSERGDDAEALRWQERAVGYDDTYPKVNLNHGRLLMIAGRTEEAAAAFARERVLDPDDPQNLASLGQALLRLGRPEEAVPAFEDAERLGMRDAPSLYNHGIALERLGRASEAEALYARAVESDSTFADAWNNLGVLLARADRLEEALDVWERGLRANPGASRIMNNIRRARERLGPEGAGSPE